MLIQNYYFSSFFWSTLQKMLTAIVGFISVPLLLDYYGADNYGILSLATACNGYMHLLDLGMNVGAVRFFSIWWSEGNREKVNRVARTNITFYSIIAIVNMLFLVAIGCWGEPLFSTSHSQFLQLRKCLFIIAGFCFFSWGTTTFHQLLIAAKMLAYTAQVQIVQTIAKLFLVISVFLFDLSLSCYFLILTMIISGLVAPYMIQCKKKGLIDQLAPAAYWGEFKVVLLFSLSVFALSLFQMTASQSRPIILGIFSCKGPLVNAEFRIVEVIPQLIITISSTLSTMFLPKTTELVHGGNQEKVCNFAYKWTVLTTIVTCCLCTPFVLGAKEALSAYVGCDYSYLSSWLVFWVLITFVQMHCTPAYSLVMAKGKTKMLVFINAGSCLLSVALNALLADRMGVGSAIIGYGVYVVVNITLYYVVYYSRVLGLSKLRIFYAFLRPTLLALIPATIACSLSVENFWTGEMSRIGFILVFLLKTMVWLILFFVLLFVSRTIQIKNKKLVTRYG